MATKTEEVKEVKKDETKEEVKEEVKEAKKDEVKRKNRIRIVYGNMTWGPGAQTNKDVAFKQLEALINSPHARVKSGPEEGKVMVDTARVYRSGDSEELLGNLLQENPSWKPQVSIHTKANPRKPFTREGLNSQLNDSLKALSVDKVDIYYLHAPDIKTPIEETFGALNELHKAGKFTELGLSNYAAWDVVRIHWFCKTKGWVSPTVYQGMYNAITRSIEPELIPALRACGIRSYWYNPLAGGFLTGKYSSLDEKLTEGRFSPQFDFVGPRDTTNSFKGLGHVFYRQRYFKQKLFDSLEVIRHACEAEKIAMADAAMRWVVHHSVLNGNYHDGVLFGASSFAHMEANLTSYGGDELPKNIVEAFDNAWTVAAPESESYMRGYGAKPGGSELFLAQY